MTANPDPTAAAPPAPAAGRRSVVLAPARGRRPSPGQRRQVLDDARVFLADIEKLLGGEITIRSDRWPALRCRLGWHRWAHREVSDARPARAERRRRPGQICSLLSFCGRCDTVRNEQNVAVPRRPLRSRS